VVVVQTGAAAKCSNCCERQRLRTTVKGAGIARLEVSGDLDHVRVDVQTVRPGVALGHGGAELDRLRTELEELTGKVVQLNVTLPEPR
jgi:small subunit ribosomal protein S3